MKQAPGTVMDMETARPDPGSAMAAASALPDAALVRRVSGGEHALFEILMRRHNQGIYRAVRAVVRDESEIEDVMQQAYINAFTHLHQFEERSQFSTWLTRIALNEAFGRRRKMRLSESMAEVSSEFERGEDVMDTITSLQADPERQAYARELHRVLERAVDALPDTYRMVFMLRAIEGLSTSEAGEGLGLGEDVVKTRLHRARAMVRRAVTAQIGEVAAGAFQFHVPRCDRVVSAVLATISSR
jgi:RNA polymerase sigma-70 factor (ECF subfamily)